MNTYAYLIKAKPNTPAKSLFCWFCAKSDSRAEREILNILSENGLTTGREADYQQPTRTNLLFVHDLPDEGKLDATWCERYQLNADGRNWATVSDAPSGKRKRRLTQNKSHDDIAVSGTISGDLFSAEKYPWEKQLLSIWRFGRPGPLSKAQRDDIARLELDMDETYAQNVMFAARSFKTLPGQPVFSEILADLFSATKSIWPVNGEPPALNNLITFFSEWENSYHHGKKPRDEVTEKWLKKCNNAAALTSSFNSEQKPARYKRSIAQNKTGLEIEIAISFLYPEVIPEEVSRIQIVRAKNLIRNKEETFVKIIKVVSKIADIMNYDTTTIFRLTRAINWRAERNISVLRTQVCDWLTKNGIYENGSLSTGYPDGEKCPRPPRQAVIQKNASVARAGFKTPAFVSETGCEFTPEPRQSNNGVAPPLNAVPPGDRRHTERAPERISRCRTAHHRCNLFTHLMVDLKTMGNTPDAPIISIGAAFFNPYTGDIGSQFYKVISLASSMASGAIPDASTIIWWLKQSSAARSPLVREETIPLEDALLQFNEFIGENAATDTRRVQVWGNGTTFNNVLLRRAYHRTRIRCPWECTNDRDVRTVVEMGKAVGFSPSENILFDNAEHDALAGALQQIKYVSTIWQKLTEK